MIVDLCLALEGKDDELFPPLRAVCSSLDPGGPLGLPRRDLMEYTELRKQYWTIQRVRRRPSIVSMVDKRDHIGCSGCTTTQMKCSFCHYDYDHDHDHDDPDDHEQLSPSPVKNCGAIREGCGRAVAGIT